MFFHNFWTLLNLSVQNLFGKNHMWHWEPPEDINLNYRYSCLHGSFLIELLPEGEMVKYEGIQLTCHSLYFLNSFRETNRGEMGRTRTASDWFRYIHKYFWFMYTHNTHIGYTNLLHRCICNIIGRKRQLIHFHWWGCPLFIFAFKWWQPNEAVLKDWYDHIVSQKPKCVFGTDFLYSRILPKQLQVKMNYSTCQNHQRILLWWKSIEGNTNTKILK